MPDEQAQREDLACQEVVELVTDYLENALLPRTRALLDDHLAGCEGCTAYFDQVQRTIMLLRQLTQQPISSETKHELLETFRAWKDTP